MRPLLSSRVLRAIFVAVVLLAYPVAGLYPYEWVLPRLAVNTAQPLPDTGLVFAAPGPGLARTKAPPEWLDAAIEAHSFDVDLRVRPLTLDQKGPARILTLSLDPSLRNFTVAQDGQDLVVRLRTPKHSFNGTPNYVVSRVFRELEWTDIRVTVEPRSLRVEVNGEVRLADDLPKAPLQDWDRSYRLALGNELTSDRVWLGEIRQAIVRAPGTSIDYAERGFLEMPSRIWLLHNPIGLTPLRDLQMGDVLVNLVGFLPLGFLLGVWASSRGRRPWFAVLAVIGTSLAIEVLQVAIPLRYPTVNDLIFNTLGGSAGIVLARWFRRRTAARQLNSPPS